MKHLRKFNEKIGYIDGKAVTIEYVLKSCEDTFAELIDDGKIMVGLAEDDEDGDGGYILVDLEELLLPNFNRIKVATNVKTNTHENFIDFLDQYKKYTDFLEDIDVAIKRLKDEFSNLKITFQMPSCISIEIDNDLPADNDDD